MNASRLTAAPAALLLSLTLLVAGCATTVQRVEPNKAIDLSGAWNDTDSQMVSAEMVKDVLNRPWINDFAAAKKHEPAVIVGEVRNLSHEHINVNTFMGDLERALINSGQVEVVASSGERQEVREERKEQDIHASEKTRKAMGEERGADFMLKGSINTIIDASGDSQVRYYQIDLVLISMTDNRKVWAGQKKIKKLVERSKLTY